MVQTSGIRINARVGDLDASHEVTLDALDELFADLMSVPALKPAERDVAGPDGKGALAELVVELGSSGSIAAFAQIVRLWGKRDRHRSLTVSITDDASGRVIRIEGENISVSTLTEALGATTQQEGEAAQVPGNHKAKPRRDR